MMYQQLETGDYVGRNDDKQHVIFIYAAIEILIICEFFYIARKCIKLLENYTLHFDEMAY